LAKKICDGEFNVLDAVTTFEEQYFSTLLFYLRLWKLDAELISRGIRLANNPFRLRILISIAGHLEIATATPHICQRLMDSYGAIRGFETLTQNAIPTRDVIAHTLKKMPAAALPYLLEYKDIATKQKRWQQKCIFEQAIKAIQRIQ
jgi:hypothetical protein